MRSRFHATATILAFLAGAQGCKEKPPMGMYCEGGVVDGRSDGGECIQISTPAAGADPASVGSAVWVSTYAGDRYSVRRIAKRKYELYLKGTLAGTLDVGDGAWITVKFSTEPRTYHLRSDRAGLMI